MAIRLVLAEDSFRVREGIRLLRETQAELDDYKRPAAGSYLRNQTGLAALYPMRGARMDARDASRS